MRRKIVRIFTGYKLTEEELAKFLPGESLIQSDYQIFLNTSGPADMTLVFSYAPLGSWSSGNKHGIYKVVADPVQGGLFGRFTRTVPKWATRVLTPTKAQARNSDRFIYWHTLVFWHLGKSLDQLIAERPEKRSLVSCVASAKRDLPGHKIRDDFVRKLESEVPQIDVYGRGRNAELPSGKWDGVAPYHFSIAIENAVVEGYFTEKILDCFLARTIPIYYGATDIVDYFPEESIIKIESLEPSTLVDLLDRGVIGSASYEKRLQALEQARQTVLRDHTLDSMICKLLSGPNSSVRPGRQSLTTLDSLAHKIRDVVAKLVQN